LKVTVPAIVLDRLEVPHPLAGFGFYKLSPARLPP
jgi:hypothetical protein